jgi:multimeric flavodoxin WrbA
MATPVYFYTMAAQVKTLIDRSLGVCRWISARHLPRYIAEFQ